MPDAEGLIGTLVGNRYQVLERLGAGGMAVVYRVLDQDTQRVWALKVMAAELAPDVAAQRRFKSEHRVMQALHHPGIPQVQALGLTAEGLPYFAMELVEGEALPAGETWPEGAIRNLVAELMPILAHLHRQGLVHGDLKAENLMRTTQGALKLMDFGLAGPAGTRAQGLEGTVSHLAPELIQRGRADQRSDLYAAGVLLYELAAGRLPHVGGSAAETLKLHLTAAPASLRSLRPELSADLEALIGRLLAKRPLDRPQSANEVLRALGLPAEEEDSLALPLQGPFVGRQTLLSQLVAAAGEAANGHRPRPIALLGAAGLGKSRLLEEAASQARLIDLPTVTGLCAADPIPYGPWVDLARELLALGRSIAPEPAQQLQQALRPFTGGAKDEGGDLGGALKVALLRLLEAVATHRGLLVLLDDWHAADGPSHKLLNALLELTSKAPIAWVVATNQPVGDALAETPLPPLPADEVARMVASNLGCEQLDEAVASQIVAATQGSPRFIEELLRYLLATRQLVRRQAGWQLVSGGGHALPNGLQSLYAARIADLSDEALRLVRLLSLHAASLSAEMAACALEVSQATIDEALATLQTRQFVKQDDLGFRLSDPQFAAWLASQLSPEEAQGLHGRLFEALAALSEEPRSLRTVNALAQHGLLGPTPLTARHWMLEAARQNLAMGAFAEARHFSQAAFEVADDMPPATCLELLEIRATAHRSLGEADLALSVSEEAVRLADMLGDVTLLARSLNGLGKIHQLASRYEAARAAFERATEVAKDQAPLELCRSLRALGRLCFFAGDMDGAYRNGLEALALARTHALPAERARVLAEVGETFQGEESRLQEGLRCLEEAQAIAHQLADPVLESFTSSGLGNLQLALGQLLGAKMSFARAAELHENTGNSGEALFSRLNLAIVAEEQGFFSEAETLATAVEAEARRVNRKFPMAAAIALAGSAAGHLGRTREGLARLGEAVEVADSINHKLLRALIHQIEAPLRCLLGQFNLAEEKAAAMATFGEASGAPEFTQRAQLIRGEVALQTGRPAEAMALLEPLLLAPNAAVRLRALRLRGEAACRLGDEGGAFQALHAARTASEEVGAPRDAGLLYLLSARLEGGDVGGKAAELAVRLLETTQQRHLLPLALHVWAECAPPNQRTTHLSRAQELIQAMAAALGDEAEAYLQAYGRAEIVAKAQGQRSLPVPNDWGATPPTTLEGLVELAGRLSQGLAAFQVGAAHSFGFSQDRTARRLEQVVSFARVVNASLQVDTVVDRALALIIEITSAERGMFLLREGPAVLTQRYATAPDFRDDDGGAEQYSRSIARSVLETGETVCVLDALSDPRFAQQASIMGMNLQTIIAVPLKDQNETIGAIYVDRQGLSDQFTQGDLEIVQVLAGLTGVALANARLMKQQMDNVLQLDQLNKLSRSVSRTLELEKVLDIITQVTLEVIKAERSLIFLWEEEQLIFGAGRDQDGPLPQQAGRERSDTICQKVVDTLAPVHVVDTGLDAEFATKMSVLNLKIASAVAVPLLADSGLTGVLYIDSRSRGKAALEKEVQVLQAIANTAALAVQNARHYREATVDHLTGLYVRSLFLRRTDEEIRRTRRFGGRFSLLVLDIDHFKKFNDSHGHQTGDAVLRLVAKTVREAVRVGLDVPCRYGGEEMVILLPETDTAGAIVSAERIRRQIELATLPGPDGSPLRVTVSVGVATFPAMAETATELFERADQALYVSKREGRNRVSVYEAEVKSV